MLTGDADPTCRAKVEEELERNPALRAVVDALRESDAVFGIDPNAGGLEIVPGEGCAPSAGRCRMKLFRPREERERLCAFFFKKSNIAGSRDRFSYGAVEFQPDRLADPEVRAWIQWLASGLDPELRPTNLRRAFLYTIPE